MWWRPLQFSGRSSRVPRRTVWIVGSRRSARPRVWPSPLPYPVKRRRRIVPLFAAAGLKRRRARMAAVRSVPGVGPVTAAALCLEIFRHHRFKKPEEIAGYLGLAPWSATAAKEGKGAGSFPPAGNGSAPFSSRRLGPGSDTTQAPESSITASWPDAG